MRKFSWIICCAILAICLIFAFPAEAHAVEIVDSGTCGENLTWTLDDAGVLTISGTGDMTNWSYATSPWHNNAAVKTVVVENGVTSIGGYAFYSCNYLTRITIPDSITTIRSAAFTGCSGLTDVYITDPNVWCKTDFATRDSNPAYWSDSLHILDTQGHEISSVVLDSTVTEIPDFAFKNSSITSIAIGDSVTSIGYDAFAGCSNMTCILVDENNAVYSSDNFGVLFDKNKETLVLAPQKLTTHYTIPDSVTSISSYAFEYCTQLTSIIIPDSVTSIGHSAFLGCNSLESMTIPFVGEKRKSHADTYQYPFGYIFGTTNYTGGAATKQYYYGSSVSSTTYNTYYIPATLKTITVTDGNILYGAFAGCTSLTSITIGDSSTSIGSNAFAGCSSLTSITIGDGVTQIGWDAFKDCSKLSSVIIPCSVTSIGSYAFENCSGLNSVKIQNGITTLSSSVFLGCNNVELMVLPESLTQINGEKSFFDIFTSEDFSLGVVPGSYAEKLAVEYNVAYKYVFEGLYITKDPIKKIFFTEEDLDLSGIVVWYGDETGETRVITDYSVTGYDSEPGVKTITLSYQGYSDSFAIAVVDKNDFASGSGHEEDPFLIHNIEELLAIEKYNYPVYYQLANNITLPDNWKPICDATSPFIGSLDGNGFAISNLTTDSAAPSRTIGLFHTNNGIITNLTVADVNVNATYLAGSVNVGCIAVNNNGTISNCSAVGKINILMDDKSSYGSTSSSCVGGIAAYNSGTITGCRNEVDIVVKSYPSTGGSSSVFKEIHATIYAGGVVGNSSGGTLIYNENYGDISVTTSMGTSSTTDTVYELNAYAGGIAAYSYGSIQQSRNFGNVSSGLGMTGVAQSRINTAVYAGGIVGDGGPCTNCYNTGNVSSNGHTFVVYRESVNGSWKFYARGECYFGGIAGNGSASTCYSIGRVIECGPTDNSNYIQAGTFKSGSICGGGSTSACYSGTDDSMKQQSTYVGFDFDTIWRMPTAGEYVYPVLQCFADKLDSIFVSTLPEKLTYLDSQETLDLTGGMLTLVYGDGKTQTIQITTDMVRGFDNKITGKQSVYIQYLGRTTSFEVEVIASTITFVDYDGTIISSRTYRYGETITPPDTPTRSSDNTYTYAFAGWDTEVTICQGNATYTATYDAEYIEYTVEFQNWDGAVISRTKYHYGDAVLAPTNVGRPADKVYSYRFAGWDNDVTVCQGNAVYTAVYQESLVNYTVTFQNYDGSVISSKTYHYGDTVEIPVVTVTPSDKVYNYYFIGWDSDVTTCQGNTTYTAAYSTEYIEYTIIFKNWDGSLISSKTYHYGETIEVPATPKTPADQMYNYAFAGWDKEVVACIGDATYTAIFEKQFTPGDIDGDNAVTQDDAVYLLLHTMFGEMFYPLNNAPADIDGSGTVNQEDAVYLLLHTMFGEMFYPLNIPASSVADEE